MWMPFFWTQDAYFSWICILHVFLAGICIHSAVNSTFRISNMIHVHMGFQDRFAQPCTLNSILFFFYHDTIPNIWQKIMSQYIFILKYNYFKSFYSIISFSFFIRLITIFYMKFNKSLNECSIELTHVLF